MSTTNISFNSQGKLRRGIHSITWKEFVTQFTYNQKRQELARGVLRAIRLLQKAGCQTIYIGGSYVTTKKRPADVEVLWESSNVDWGRLRRVSPIFFEMTPGSPEQKKRFSSEFYPTEGIETISGLSFFEFFQRDCQKGRRRGLVRIDISGI